jgi:FAD:protein FMN transferase
MTSVLDRSFACMGSDVRLLIESGDAVAAADDAEAFVRDFAARLTRFDPASELSRLNADPRCEVPVSPLLAAAVGAGRWGAERTGGLVDPTLLGALEAAGYAASRRDAVPASLAAALAAAPPRRPARPDPRARWRALEVDGAAGIVRRPPGLAVDTGGTGKGLAADAIAHRLRRAERFLVDCGGDLAVGGAGSAERPWDVEVVHPLTGERAHVLRCRSGGVATSGLDVRLWRRAGGGYAHHLLDPSTGEPAWTGLVGVTALGASALEAEVLAKAALLSGPDGARRVLGEHGGLLVHDDGDVELAGPVRSHFSVRIAAPRPHEAAA